MLSSSIVKTYQQSGSNFCGKPDPFSAVQGISDLETRLHVLTLLSILDAFSVSAKIATAASNPDHWLLKSSETAYKQSKEVGAALVQLRLGGAQQDGRVWWQVTRGIQGRFKGSLAALLEANQYDAETLFGYLQESKATFPVLSGPVISIRWLDLVSRYGDRPLKNWETLKIPFSAGLKRKAGFADQSLEMIHPAAAAAIEHWAASCDGGGSGSCGWGDCPNKQS